MWPRVQRQGEPAHCQPAMAWARHAGAWLGVAQPAALPQNCLDSVWFCRTVCLEGVGRRRHPNDGLRRLVEGL